MKNRLFLWIFVIFLMINLVNAEVVCEPDWTCSDWSECINSYENRTCSDINFCGNEETKPQEFKECEAAEPTTAPIVTEPEETEPETCVENWKCTPWSTCIDNIQIRNCFDDNACNTELQKPEQEQSCTTAIAAEPVEPIEEEPGSFATYLYIFFGLILIGGLGFLGYSYLSTHRKPTQPQKPEQDPVMKYVNQMRAAGYNNNQIRNELTKSGYDQEKINQHLPPQNPQLKQFTKQMLTNGYNFNQIQDHLLCHGYEHDEIQKYLR